MNANGLGALGKMIGMRGLDVDTYRKQLANVLGGQQSGVVFNGTIEHASLVVEEAFLAAESHVRILTHTLDCACYAREGIRAAMRDFMAKPRARLDILVEDDTGATTIWNRAFIRDAACVAEDRIFIGKVPSQVWKTYAFNLLVVDEKAYRFEENREVPVAVVAGGEAHAHGVANLIRIFEAIKRTCDVVPHELVATPA